MINVWNKHKRKLRVIDHPKAFRTLRRKQAKRSLGTDATVGSLKSGDLDSLIPRLKSKPLSSERILIISQNRSLGPRGKLSDQTDCQLTVCVRSKTVLWIDWTRNREWLSKDPWHTSMCQTYCFPILSLCL